MEAIRQKRTRKYAFSAVFLTELFALKIYFDVYEILWTNYYIINWLYYQLEWQDGAREHNLNLKFKFWTE